MEDTGLPITYFEDEYQYKANEGAPVDQFKKPSFGTSMLGTVYGATAEGSTNTLARYIDAKLGLPSFSSGGGIAGAVYDIYQAQQRPKLDQTKVDQLWAGAGIPDKAPDASQYTDVAVYYLLDAAKRRQAMRDIDSATEWGAGSAVRGLASFGLQALDPLNVATGFFPAGTAFKAVGLSKAAATMVALEAASETGASLITRVGARAAVGAIEGTVGNIPLEAATGYARSQMGEDYTAIAGVKNIALGAAIGSGLHVAIGGLKPRLSRTLDAENEKVKAVIDNTPEAERANLITPDNELTAAGFKAVADNEIKAKFGDSEPIAKLNNEDIQYKLLDASEDFKGFDNQVIGEDLSIKQDFDNAIDLINKSNLEDSNIQFEPNQYSQEAVTLADWLSKPTTTPRMIAEALNNYNDRITNLVKQEGKSKSGQLIDINKSQVLQEEISKVKPTPAELADIITPQTKEDIMTMGSAQMEADVYPTIDAMQRADKNIGTANLDDIKTELKKMDDPENSYVTNNAPEEPRVDIEIPKEGEIDYAREIPKLDKMIADAEELAKLKLYSVEQTDKVNTPTNIKTLQDEIIKQFGDDGQKLLDLGKIKIVENVADIPDGPHSPKTKGVTFGRNDVYLVAKNISPSQVKGIVLHEVGIHSNINNLLGEEGFNTLIKQMNKFVDESSDLKGLLDRAVKDVPEQYKNEERLAYLVEHTPDAPFVQQLIAKVKAWLYKTFPSLRNALNLTDYDIAELALASLRNYSRELPSATGAEGKMYSTISEQIISETDNELTAINDTLSKVEQYKNTYYSISDEMVNYVNDKQGFTRAVRDVFKEITPEQASDVYDTFKRAYSREVEVGTPNPEISAINYMMGEYEYGWKARKLALIKNKAVFEKGSKYLEQWTNLPSAGIDSMLTGTRFQKPGSRANSMGAEISNAWLRHGVANFERKMKTAGLSDMFLNGAEWENTMRAMAYISKGDNEKLSKLPKEAQAMGKIISDSYLGILTEQRENGLLVNRLPDYYFNQKYMNSMEKVRTIPRDEFIADAKQHYNAKRIAESINKNISDVNDDFFGKIYDQFATGVYDDIPSDKGSASYGDMFIAGQPFKKVKNQQRVLHFNDVEDAVWWFNKYGSGNFAEAVANTVRTNSKKIGILKVGGIDYEANIKALARDLSTKITDPQIKEQFLRNYNDDITHQLMSLDGRASIPGRNWLARAGATARAILSTTMLSKAGVAGFIGDPYNSALYKVRMGYGKSLTLNYLESMKEMVTPYSPEKKALLTAFGISCDNILTEPLRYGANDNGVPGWLAKTQNFFFKYNGVSKQGDAMKAAAMDFTGSYHAQLRNVEFDSLPSGLKNALSLSDITAEEWGLMKHIDPLLADGKEYLAPELIQNIKPQIAELLKSKGINPNALEAATNKYANNLQSKLFSYYADFTSHMYLEADTGSKYITTWGGKLRPGTWAGEAAAFVMQFKQYPINYIRKVLFDQVYDPSTSTGQKSWNIMRFLVGSVFVGYMSNVAYALLSGKEPPSFKDKDGTFNWNTVGAAIAKGGGLGIFQDYLMADYNRFGGSFGEALAGPFVGKVGEALRIKSAVQTGGNPASSATRLAYSLIPQFWWNVQISNYLFYWGLQEELNPGYLNRMERRMKKDFNQEYFLPPSEYAVRY